MKNCYGNLDFIEKNLIDSLLNSSGYVLDFSNRTFQKFVYEKIQIDVYAKYKDLSKGRMLNSLIDNLDDITAGKLILKFLRYMQYKDMVRDENIDKLI